MADSHYGNTLFARTNNGLGVAPTSLNLTDTLNFGGPGAWLRFQLSWKYIETSTSTSGTPTYNWSCLDATVDACTTKGVNLLFVLQLAPDGGKGIASPGLNRLRITATGQDVGYGGNGALYASPADFKYFAQQVAARYNGTTTNVMTGQTQVARLIPALQLGNEEYDTKSANVAPWQPGGRDDQGIRLGEMLNQAAPAVKAIYPTVSLGIESIRRVPTPNYTRTHCIKWFTNVFNTIGSNAQYIDWTDFHNYRQDPTLDNNSPRAQDPSYDVPQTSAGGWPYGADVPSIATRLTDMLGVLTSFGYGPKSSHPIQVWCNETGWALYDDGNRNTDPLAFVSEALCSQYYQTAADQMRLNGGSKIMYWTIDSTKRLHTYNPPYTTHDVNGNPVTLTVFADEKDDIIQIPIGGGSPTYYAPYTDMANIYVPAHPKWPGSSGTFSTRTVPAAAALKSVGLSRTIGAAASLSGASATARNIPAVAALATSSISRSIPAAVSLAGQTRTQSIVATDSFIRGNQSGWGTASDTTDSWTHPIGSSTLSIASDTGVVGTSTGANVILLGTGMLFNGDFSVHVTSTSAASIEGIAVRYIDSNNYMRLEVTNNSILFRKKVLGTSTALTPTASLGLTANAGYWIHVNTNGNTYTANVWKDTGDEPAGWMLTCTDSSLTAPGRFGLFANPATASDTVSFDTYNAFTNFNTYYVSPSGSDSNSGTSVSPWQTLTKVNASVQAGDTAYFANGSYTGGVTLTTSGTALAPITLMASNMWGATIVEPGGAGLGTALVPVSADNIILDGFEMTGADCQYAVKLNNNYSIVQHCWIHDICNTLTISGSNEGYGIGVPGATYVSIANVIQSNRVERIGPKTSGAIVPNSQVHAIYAMTNSTGTQSAIQNNLIILASGYGIALYHNPQNWLITNNTIMNCKTGGLKCLGDTGSGYTADYDIIQNTIFMECGGVSSYYPAIWSASDSCGAHNIFRTNLAYHPSATAVYDFTPANVNPRQSATNLPNANPQFMNYASDGSGNYHLSLIGSPASDAGTATLAPLTDYDGVSRPQGLKFDVGAYESFGTLTITVGGTPVVFDEDSFKLTPKVNERWRCQFTVLDYTGTQFFSYGELVVVRDPLLGTLFTGFVSTAVQDKSNVYGSSATEHQIDCIDNRHRADKRTSNRLYTRPSYAGKIATDMYRDVLAGEGVIAYYASHTDEQQTDFAQGTLTNVAAPASGLALLSSSAVTGLISSSADWTSLGSSSNLQINSGGDVQLNAVARTWDDGVFSGQTLYGLSSPSQQVSGGQYELTSVADSLGHAEVRSRLDFAGTWANGTLSVDILLDGDTSLHSFTYRTTNWNNNDGTYAYAIELSTGILQLMRGGNGSSSVTQLAHHDFSPLLSHGWYTVKVVFSGSSHTVYLNGTQYLSVTDGTYTAAGSIALRSRNLHTTGTETDSFDNFGIAAALSGTWTQTSATSIGSIAAIANSSITWDQSLSTGTKGTDTVQVSTDGGSTFTTVSNGGALPGLTPGSSGSGKSIVVKVVLATTAITDIPHIRTVQWAVNGGYVSSGTRTSIPLSTYGTDTFTRTNQSGWGTASDGQKWYFDQGSGVLAIVSNEGTVTGSGSANFVRMGTNVASDINESVRFALANTGDTVGILLRYTDTSNFYRATFGNGTFLIEKYVKGVQTTLVQQTFTQSTGSFYYIRFQASSNTLVARYWASGATEPTVWGMSATDNDLTGGNFGLSASPASGAAVQFDHLSAISQGVTPGLDLTPVGRVGSTFIEWVANEPTNTALGVDVSLDLGTTWVDVSGQNGGPLPGITTQPDPTIDTFSSNSSAQYTSTSGNGGSAATVTHDTANNRILLVGGSQAIYAYHAIVSGAIDVYCDLDESDAGGLVLSYSDQNDYYAIVVADDHSTVSQPNTLTLYKTQGIGYSTTVLADSPQAYYRLDETSGTTAADATLFNRDATYSASGITYAQTGAISGDSDTSATFDGTAGSIICPSSIPMSALSAFTVEAWVNLSNITFSGSARVATNSTTTTNNKGFALYFTASAASLNFAIGNGTTFGQAVYTTTFAAGTWYHIVGTYDGTTITLYVNGASVATATVSGTMAAGTNPINIGRNVSSGGFAPATFDEVAVYNAVLSSGQVLVHYNSGQGIQQGSSTSQLAQASIDFPRGIYRRIRAKNVDGTITVNFEDQQAISFTDATPLVAGSPGLFNDGGTARFYELWMQPLGDDVTGVIVHTRLRLSTGNVNVSPQVFSLSFGAYGPHIGNGTLIPSADYRYTFVDKNFDDIAKQSNYSWWIDPDLLLNFIGRLAQPAPWILQSNALALPSDIILDGNLSVEVSGDLYRNRQILTNVLNTAVFVDPFAGDGQRTSFTLSYPLDTSTASFITITVNTVPQVLGLKGTTGADWYYAEGDPVIAQDKSGKVLTSSDTMIVTYTGQFSDTVIANNTDAQAALKAVAPGTTGIIEAVEDVKGMRFDAAVVYANQLLERYCFPLQSMRTVVFATNRDGLQVGQVQASYVPEENLIGAALLINSMDITFKTQPGNTRLYLYIVTASELAPIGSWAKLFSSGLLN